LDHKIVMGGPPPKRTK